MKCPVCKSEEIVDNSLYESNGVYGPGYSSTLKLRAFVCKECGVMFQPTKNNKL